MFQQVPQLAPDLCAPPPALISLVLARPAAIGDAMVANGLRDAGYVYVNLDDGWVGGRFPNGSIIADPKVFPNGVRAVADYLHSIGMKLGLYTSRGQTTCLRCEGSQDHEALDMQQYADWAIDYVKVDSCVSAHTQSAVACEWTNPTVVPRHCGGVTTNTDLLLVRSTSVL